MRIPVNIVLVIPWIAILTIVGAAQNGGQPTLDDLQKRIVELEAQLRTLTAEISNIKEVNKVPAAAQNNSTGTPNLAASLAASKMSVEPVVKKEPDTAKKKDLGIDIGSARLTPYGTIYFNAFGNSGGTNNADVPIFATSTGSGNVSASVRQTRLGLKLDGAKVGNARLGAVLEGDFFGGFPSVGIGENFGIFRVRLAYARLDWERTSVTAGQDWMVFAPVNPTSMAAAGNPQMGAAGNNWARLPQVKIEKKIGDHITWQGALLEPQTGDFATSAAFVIQPTSGASSRVPFFQSRVAFSEKTWFGTNKPGTIGLSGQYGHSRVFTGPTNVRNDIESTGVALDWNFPLADRVNVSGEAFFGRNLGGFQAGVFQSYNNDFAYRIGTSLIAGGVRSIGTQGGWTQITFTPPVLNNRLGIYGSVGIDDPNNQDLVSISHRDWRTRNLVFAGDLIYKFTPQFSIGAEIRRLQTNYFYGNRQNANHVNLGASYTF